jgi:hypothetical protein
MNYQRLYEYRFRDVDQRSRRAVWREIARRIHEMMGSPSVVLDPAAGRCEFINAVPAVERWAVDTVPYNEADTAEGLKFIVSSALDVELPPDYFEGIFVSNFLEHLATPEHVAGFLARMLCALRPAGRMAILGPNFKYCAKDYFDCADHVLALTEVSIAEHLYSAGFRVTRIIPRFLPYSFRGLLPPSPTLTRLYLRFPLAWRVLGKQFLVVGEKVGSDTTAPRASVSLSHRPRPTNP